MRFALLAAMLLAGTAQAQTATVAQAPAEARIVARATSPDKSIALAISIDNDGRASYSIARRGKQILRDSGMSISDIDLFEVNEAFASVVLRFMQAFQVDPARVNVNGGAMAMGHPLGATGAIIIGTLLDELERQDKETGLATLCIASGMGAATIIERV